MTIEILTIPCLSDNYAFLVHENDTGETALVDVPEAAPILDVLNDKGWSLSWILLTHHHDDHIQGVPEILRHHDAKTIGAQADQHRLPPLDAAVSPGDVLTICGQATKVWEVSGHTIGHIAFIMESAQAAFTGDSLMALGCGRLFEGSFAQMWESLSQFAALDGNVMIFSGHEYTAANAKFAASVDPQNPELAARSQKIDEIRRSGGFTVPSLLSEERATNPFLRASDTKIRKTLNMVQASDADVFGEIRRRKDNF